MSSPSTPTMSLDDGFVGWNDPIEEDNGFGQLDDDLERLYDDHSQTAHKLIGCIIPAYNEEKTIAATLESLLAQTTLPDEIHVIVNNSNDRTVEKAREFAGVHRQAHNEHNTVCAVYVHDIGKNAEKKVGALNYGYSMIAPFDYILGVDGDTVAEPDAIATLLKEIESAPHIGGVSAIFTIADSTIKGPIASWLVAGQRAQFAAFNLKAMQHHRNISVLGGQFSLFSVRALEDVMKKEDQATPWIKTSEVEDSLLSLQIKSAGYDTMLSAGARAYVGGMTTLRALDGQQVKWNSGAVELMRSNPRHPSLQQRWMENISMLFNGYNRFVFIFLLISSLSISAFVFYPVWAIPTVVSTLLNLKIAMKIRSRDMRDILFAVLFIPAELYLWVRIGHFLRAWWKALFGGQSDNWAAQAKAERGQGNAYLSAPVAEALIVVVCVFIQFHLPLDIQTTVLQWGWVSLAMLTFIQTCIMLFSLLRPSHGARV